MSITIPTMRRTALLAVGGVAATALTAGLGAAPAQAAEVDLVARMHATTAYPNARGHAEYDKDSDGREFDISISGVQRLAGHRVAVRVHGDLVGRMRINQHGRAHLDKHTGVPRMMAGNVVRVRTGAGTLVTYGALHHDTDVDD